MIDEDKYCIDILKQIAAVQGTLTAITRDLAHSHIIHCVQTLIGEGSGVQAVEELLETLRCLQRVDPIQHPTYCQHFLHTRYPPREGRVFLAWGGGDTWMPELGLGHNVYMGIGYLISALAFGSLFYAAIRYLIGSGGSRNEDRPSGLGMQ